MEELAFKLQPTTTVQPNLNHHTASLQPCSTLSNPNQTQHIINPQNKTKQRKIPKKKKITPLKSFPTLSLSFHSKQYIFFEFSLNIPY